MTLSAPLQVVFVDDYLFFTVGDYIVASNVWFKRDFTGMGMHKEGELVVYNK